MTKIRKLNAPSNWASPIINLDYSGLEDSERGHVNTWLGFNDLSFSDCLNCDPLGVGEFEGVTCNLSTYTFKA
jgi:hypothetical protein